MVTLGGDDAARGAFELDAEEFIAAKSFKAKGKRVTNFQVESIEELEPRPGAEEEIVEGQLSDDTNDAEDEIIVSDQSDDEVRDEINGQQRIF